jgi:hypothetical protein
MNPPKAKAPKARSRPPFELAWSPVTAELVGGGVAAGVAVGAAVGAWVSNIFPRYRPTSSRMSGEGRSVLIRTPRPRIMPNVSAKCPTLSIFGSTRLIR